MKNFKLKKSEDFFVSRDFVRGTEHIKKNFSKIKNYLTDLNWGDRWISILLPVMSLLA